MRDRHWPRRESDTRKSNETPHKEFFYTPEAARQQRIVVGCLHIMGARMPSKSRSNGLPAYQRIQGTIRKRIDAGDLRTGDAVPSERDLARIHQVSLMTARHALATLEREGVVERRRGIGTFVSAPKIHFNKLMSYTEQMASRSMTAGSKVLFSKIIDDEQEANARLSLSPKSGVLKLERLRHAAGEPFALETCYLSAAQFPDCSRRRYKRNHCSEFWNASTRWKSGMPTRRWTQRQRIHARRICLMCHDASRYFVFDKLFFRRAARRFSMCSVFTGRTAIIW